MKKITTLLALALLGLVLVATPDSRAQASPPKPGFGNVSSADELKEYPFEKRIEFESAVKNLAARIDARITGLSTRAAAESASNPGLTKAVELVKAGRADLDGEISRITSAKAENWESTRDGVLETLTRVQSACDAAARG